MTRITDYTALTAPAGADVFPVVDVSDTSMSAAGTTKKITLADIAGYAPLPPSGDTTGATDSANLASLLAGEQAVVLLPGTHHFDSPALPDSTQAITGVGPSTIVKAGSGWSGAYIFQLAHPASTYQVTIRNMTIVPGTLSGSTLSGPGGVQIDNTGWPGGTTTINGSTRHVLDNILVFNSGGDAFHLDNKLTDCLFTRLASFRSGGKGFYIGAGTGGGGVTDSHFTDCVSGFSSDHGFYVAGANLMFNDCKSFTSGNNFYTGTFGNTQCGFEITSAGGSGNRNAFNGCQAQQSGLYGFDLQTVDSIAIVGCDADSNGAATAGVNGAGINLNTVTNSTIIGNIGAQFLTPGNQTYGIQHQAGVSSGTWIGMNSLYGSVVGFQFVAGSGFFLIDQVATDFSQVTGQFRVGTLEMFPRGIGALSTGNTITTQATFGTYPVSLTGAVTGIILAPAAFGGQQIVIVNTSATHSLTFAAAGTSNVADGVSDVIQPLQAAEFTWDANTSLWYRM